MLETLSSYFQKSKGKAIELNGRLIQPIYQEKINSKHKIILIKRIKAINSPVQGIRIKAVNGSIKVNDQSHSEIILWADTSPESVSIEVSSKSGCELKYWNVWKAGEIAQAWVGNAGIHVRKMENVVTLECSDGSGEVDLSNLVVQIEELN